MAGIRVESPDGREWEVFIRRVQLPEWPHYEADPSVESDDVFGFLLYPILAPVFGLVFVVILPLLQVLVLMPFALARPLVSSTCWVEAESLMPSHVRMVWQTTRAEAKHVREYVAARIPFGYDKLTPPEATLVTRPIFPS